MPCPRRCMPCREDSLVARRRLNRHICPGHDCTLKVSAGGAFLRASRCVRCLANSWSKAAQVAATSPCGAMGS